METAEKAVIEKILWWRNEEAEKDLAGQVQAAAKALNKLLEKYNFDKLTEIPPRSGEWLLKRVLENDKELQQLSKIQTVNLSTIPADRIPRWLKEIAGEIDLWNSRKSQYIPYMEYLTREENTYKVNAERLEQEFDNSANYRRYIREPQQIERLNMVLTYLQWMENLGVSEKVHIRAKWHIPFTTWNVLDTDRLKLFKDVNMNFVINGL